MSVAAACGEWGSGKRTVFVLGMRAGDGTYYSRNLVHAWTRGCGNVS